METKAVDKLTDEIANLKQALQLLEHVWSEIGPYNNVISSKLTEDINRFFRFDDSE